MKIMIKMLASVAVLLVMTISLKAQKIDAARMERDIEVAENVLATLIRQQFDKQRMFFGLEVDGSYQEGYGVTFRIPADYTTPIVVSGDFDNVMWLDGDVKGSYSYSFSTPREKQRAVEAEEDAVKLKEKSEELKGKARNVNADSVREVYNSRLIEASKNFLVDYGDMISQLGNNERIVITNQGEQPRIWVGRYFSSGKRTRISLELSKADLNQFKQGKINRDQALAKIKVINTESVENADPDLELLTSIFSRLYKPDLSKTYFADGGIYFERLKDFGAVYYMSVYSSNELSRSARRYSMPTIALSDVDQETRDKKVKELYPAFEKELKENILEYGRTVKSLKDDESLIFNVKLTKCEGCGIPSSLEVAVKSSVLKDYSAGKTGKDAALAKITVKKGAAQ